MIKQIGRFALTALLLLAVAFPAVAQFEGKIVFNSYDVTTDGSQKQNDQFTLYLTGDRIMLEGKNQYNVIGSIPTEGILVRLDFEDFVFLTGKETAMKISRKDIDSMMKMFNSEQSSRGQGSTSPEIDADVNYEKTGETSQINGYSCEKFVFREKENSNNHAEVWLTSDLKINWGMLAEPWGNTELDMMGDNLSFDLIFKEGYFPLRMETYESGKLTGVTEASEISESNIAKAMVQVPQGVQVLSFQDYLFNKMSQQ